MLDSSRQHIPALAPFKFAMLYILFAEYQQRISLPFCKETQLLQCRLFLFCTSPGQRIHDGRAKTHPCMSNMQRNGRKQSFRRRLYGPCGDGPALFQGLRGIEPVHGELSPGWHCAWNLSGEKKVGGQGKSSPFSKRCVGGLKVDGATPRLAPCCGTGAFPACF